MTNKSRPNIVYSVCQCVVVLLSWWYVCFWLFNYYNRPISQIPQCIRQIPHNAPYCNRNVHTCAHFCYKMVHCGIWDCWIVGFVRWVYYPSTSEIILNGTGKADRVLTKAKQSRVQSLYIFLVFALVWLATKLLTQQSSSSVATLPAFWIQHTSGINEQRHMLCDSFISIDRYKKYTNIISLLQVTNSISPLLISWQIGAAIL